MRPDGCVPVEFTGNGVPNAWMGMWCPLLSLQSGWMGMWCPVEFLQWVDGYVVSC